MSADRTHAVLSTAFRVQTRADRARSPWNEDPAVRVFSDSPGVTALQIRGKLGIPSAPPAYAHARLSDAELLWLHAAIEERLHELGLRPLRRGGR